MGRGPKLIFSYRALLAEALVSVEGQTMLGTMSPLPKKGCRRDLAPQPSTFQREMLFSYSLRLAWCHPTPPGDSQGWLKLASIHLLRSHLTPIYPRQMCILAPGVIWNCKNFSLFSFVSTVGDSITIPSICGAETYWKWKSESHQWIIRHIRPLKKKKRKKNKKKLELLFPPNVAVPNPFSGDARRQIKAQIAVKNVGTQSHESIAAPDRRHQS